MPDYVGDISIGGQTTATDVTDLMGKTCEAKGKQYIYAKAASNLTRLTPYRVHYAGGVAADSPSVGAFTSAAVMNMVVVPTFRNLVAGDTGWFQKQGLVEGCILPSFDWVATHALRIHTGAVTTLGAVPTGVDTSLGFVNSRAGTGVVIVANVFLFGREALGTV